MKFRNAHFKNLPIGDAVKVTLPEMILNNYTGILIETLWQDVLRMSTIDWLKLLLFPIRLALIPVDSYIERKNILEWHKGEDAINYVEFRLYWRDFSDFETKPYRWNR